MRNKISDILSRYQSDTAFLDVLKPDGLYDSKYAYRFILQKQNQKNITIRFDPNVLPEDLNIVYLCLYENQGYIMHKSKFNELFEMFENQVKDDTLFSSPPLLKSTIKFTPPVIKRQK